MGPTRASDEVHAHHVFGTNWAMDCQHTGEAVCHPYCQPQLQRVLHPAPGHTGVAGEVRGLCGYVLCQGLRQHRQDLQHIHRTHWRYAVPNRDMGSTAAQRRYRCLHTTREVCRTHTRSAHRPLLQEAGPHCQLRGGKPCNHRQWLLTSSGVLMSTNTV